MAEKTGENRKFKNYSDYHDFNEDNANYLNNRRLKFVCVRELNEFLREYTKCTIQKILDQLDYREDHWSLLNKISHLNNYVKSVSDAFHILTNDAVYKVNIDKENYDPSPHFEL